jgi:SAM-dependent methyltransferase
MGLPTKQFTMDPSTLYDRAFFDMHVPWRGEYDAIASFLVQTLEFSSVLDLGCGNGFIIAKLVELGKEVMGVDGSSHILDAIPPEVASRVRILDLTMPVRIGRFDLVICSEVAEHLNQVNAATLVDNICENSAGQIFFTAATPGQGGHYHVNEQPHDYWIAMFANRGYFLEQATTFSIRNSLSAVLKTTWWFAKNAMIFRVKRRSSR